MHIFRTRRGNSKYKGPEAGGAGLAGSRSRQGRTGTVGTDWSSQGPDHAGPGRP